MLDFSNKLRELTGKVTGSVSERLNELRSNIGGGARAVGGAATFVAGLTTRSSSLTASGIEVMTGTRPEEKPVVNTNDQETKNAQSMQRSTGYASDDLGNRKERLPLSERLQIAKESPHTINELLNEEERKLIQIETVDDKNFFDKAKRVFSGEDKEVKVTVPFEPRAAMIEGRADVGVVNTTPAGPVKKENLVFQEATVGNGLPYMKQGDKEVSIAEVARSYNPPVTTSPVKKVVITDPEEGTYVIDTPKKLAIANEIKAIADDIAPEYTNYLLKLAQKEGGYDREANRPEDQNPGGGVDRGIFQINSKYFPTVTDEMAQDIKFSVLWAISLIESGNPKKGDGTRTGQEKWIADPAVRRSTISIE